MDRRDERDRQETHKIEEYKKHPMINFSDSINRSMIGDISELTKGGCLAKIVVTVIVVGILFFLSKCSS